VVGVAAAVGDNGRGIAGALWRAPVIDVRIPEDTMYGIAAGMLVAAQEGARVISVTLTSPEPCAAPTQQLIDSLRAEGRVVIAAVGNEGDATSNQPANCKGVIGVGAVRPSTFLAPYSNRNDSVDLVAPGGGGGPAGTGDLEGLARHMVLTLGKDNGYEAAAGTSFAAPLVAAWAAAAWSVNPQLTAGDIERLLLDTAEPAWSQRPSRGPLAGRLRPRTAPGYGHGLLRADRLLEAAAGIAP